MVCHFLKLRFSFTIIIWLSLNCNKQIKSNLSCALQESDQYVGIWIDLTGQRPIDKQQTTLIAWFESLNKVAECWSKRKQKNYKNNKNTRKALLLFLLISLIVSRQYSEKCCNLIGCWSGHNYFMTIFMVTQDMKTDKSFTSQVSICLFWPLLDKQTEPS